MRMTLAQIETFYWIARLGSFHAAARHLNLTQPTVSVRIRELEQYLGVELFDRSGNRARLTSAGATAVAAAERMLNAAAELRRDLAMSAGFRGLLRLGTVETVARVALPAVLAHISQRRPELRVELSVDVGFNLMQRLNQRELDVVVATDPKPAETVHTELVGLIELAWIGPASHPKTALPITPGDLADERLFAHPRGSTTYQVIGDWFASAHITPRRLSVCSSLGTMTELVAAGFGFAVITPALLPPGFDVAVRILAANPPVPSRPLFVCALAEAWDREVEHLCRLVRDELMTAGALESA